MDRQIREGIERRRGKGGREEERYTNLKLAYTSEENKEVGNRNQ